MSDGDQQNQHLMRNAEGFDSPWLHHHFAVVRHDGLRCRTPRIVGENTPNAWPENERSLRGGDPLADIGVLAQQGRTLDFIMRNGEIVKDNLQRAIGPVLARREARKASIRVVSIFWSVAPAGV